MKRKFTAIPGKGIFAGSKITNRRRIMAAEQYEYDGKMFDEDQMEQIREGLEEGLDVSWYADPKFNEDQMRWIRYGLYDGLDVSIYADPKFDSRQMWEIREGLNAGLDVSQYADSKFNWYQMEQIRQGLEAGVDVSQYADPKYLWEQMKVIRHGLEAEVDVSQYADPKFDADQMAEIRKGLEAGVDVSQYADTRFWWPQMDEIRLGLEAGIDVSQYADPKYDWEQMKEIREQMLGISKPRSESKKSQVKNLQKALEKYEAEDGTYAAFENFWSDVLSEYEQPIDAELDIEYETSSRGGGEGTITFWHDGKTLWKDLQDWTETERELIEENPTPAKYKKAYKQMLLDMINNEDWESTEDKDWEE